MSLKLVVTLISVISLIGLMVFYLLPFNTVNFSADANYNFTEEQGTSLMQFYPDMRFPDSEISYRIFDCPLQKKNDMETAFEMVAEITPLTFYPVTDNEEIFVSCQEDDVFGNGVFIAGEGGPTNVTVAGQFNVITHGKILLIRESSCPNPNIAIHELFHVLGFGHSQNPENIMYSISSCEQTIGEDMLNEIARLYSIPSKPDLVFGDVSASISGRFLNMNLTVMNVGLANAGNSTLTIYSDSDVIREIELIPMQIGSGRIITIQNIFVSKINVKELELEINNNFDEISKDNNKIKLEIK